VMACSMRIAKAPAAGWQARVPEASAWLLIAAGIAIGLAPQSVSTFVFGS